MEGSLIIQSGLRNKVTEEQGRKEDGGRGGDQCRQIIITTLMGFDDVVLIVKAIGGGVHA